MESPKQSKSEALILESLEINRYIDQTVEAFAKEERKIKQAIDPSHGRRPIELQTVRANRTKAIIHEWIRLRSESLQRDPDLGSDAAFADFEKAIQSHIDLSFTGLQEEFNRTSFARFQIDQRRVAALKSEATRDVEILRRKSQAMKMEQPNPVQSKNPRKVFVVHGRNSRARDAMFSFLRAMDLDPIEWEEGVRLTGSASPYVGEILDAMFAEAQAVVVVFTGDDVARLGTRFVGEDDPPGEKNLTPQARPNVLFEAGLALGRHPKRTLLVSVGKFSKIRPFSDIGGRHILSLSNSAKSRTAVMNRLQNAGCAVNIQGKVEWLSEGDFDSADVTPDDPAKSDQHEGDTQFFLNLREQMQREQWNTYKPTLGSEAEQQAERLVQRGYLRRGPMGGYMVVVHS